MEKPKSLEIMIKEFKELDPSEIYDDEKLREDWVKARTLVEYYNALKRLTEDKE